MTLFFRSNSPASSNCSSDQSKIENYEQQVKFTKIFEFLTKFFKLNFKFFRLKEVEQTQFLLNHLPQLRDKCSQQDLNPTKTEWEGLKNPPRTVPGNRKIKPLGKFRNFIPSFNFEGTFIFWDAQSVSASQAPSVFST